MACNVSVRYKGSTLYSGVTAENAPAYAAYLGVQRLLGQTAARAYKREHKIKRISSYTSSTHHRIGQKFGERYYRFGKYVIVVRYSP